MEPVSGCFSLIPSLSKYLVCLKMWVCGRCCKELFGHTPMQDPILHDCSIHCDVTTTLTQDIQNSSVAKEVSPYSSSSSCTTAFHFCWRQKFTRCLFMVLTPWLLSLQLKEHFTFFGKRLFLQLPKSWVLPFFNPFSQSRGLAGALLA